jgi:hypothetical protein
MAIEEKGFSRNQKQRKELARRLRSADPGLEVIHPNAAGIDVGNSAHYVAVRPDRDGEPVCRFECFTADLHRMADWLKSCGVTTVAMQSTGVYWIPLFEVLERRGFQVYLVNARHTKNLPGRKSDVQESQWLLKLHTYGLLSDSFHPTAVVRTLRTYWRQRGDHAKSLEGTWQPDLLFVLKQELAMYDVYQERIIECDRQLRTHLKSFPDRLAAEPPKTGAAVKQPTTQASRTTKRNKKTQGHAPDFNLGGELQRISGVDLTRIDGIDVMVGQTIISEVGLDMGR